MRDLTPQQLEQLYPEAALLGEGGGGRVYLAEHHTHGLVAVKKINHDHVRYHYYTRLTSIPQHIYREIQILETMQPHQNIIPLLDSFTSQQSIFLVFPYVKQGDLYNYICAKKDAKEELDEEEIKKIMLGILTGVEYLHSVNIIHRDIKDQNILIDDDGNARICDFGLARIVKKDLDKRRRLTYGVGTLPYKSPEILAPNEDYSESVDMWSIGVLFYQLYTGKWPFNDDHLENIPPEISNADPVQLDIINEAVQKDSKGLKKMFEDDKIPYRARDLLAKLLELDPSKRISATEAINHSYFRLRARKPNSLSNEKQKIPKPRQKLCR
jgi:serine/threonine protein kinase